MLGSEITWTKRLPPGIVIALANIDNFKIFNDRWCQALGDEILVRISAVLKMNFRQKEVAGRWGGEEYPWFSRAPTKPRPYWSWSD